MLTKIASKYNIILKRGQRFHIIIQIIWNQLWMLRLRIYKWIKRINRPIVHYYAVCWNEEKMLPFMFDYYDQFVDHYFIYDNYSSDKSEEIIKSHNNAEIIKFKTDGFNDKIHAEIKNNCWKKSRGKADYVVVCDIDEFCFHSNITNYFSDLLSHRVSFPRSIGYNMYSDHFPCRDKNCLLPHLINTGVEDNCYSKYIVFSPNKIVETNFEVGAHYCNPVGIVTGYDFEKYRLLHYKNLGINILPRGLSCTEIGYPTLIYKTIGVNIMKKKKL